MTVNIPDCRVRLHRDGAALSSKRKGPVVAKEIKVECLDGRKVMRRKAQAGVNELIIIKPGDWK